MILVKNRKPVVGWIFMIVWLGLISIFTGIYLRDGSPKGSEAYFPFVLGIFWMAGLGGGGFMLRIPRTTVRRMPDGQLAVTEHWLWTSRTEIGRPRRITVEETKDSDGDPYFHCYVETHSGRRVAIKEGHQREEAEAARALVLEQLERGS